MLFSDIYGLTDIKQALTNSVKQNHVAHAQMFIGRKGSANLALALAFATYVNCENTVENDACGECDSCKKMEKHIHPDVHFVYPSYKKSGKEVDNHKTFLQKTWREFLIASPYRVEFDWAETIQADNKQCIISVDNARYIKQFLSLKSFKGGYKIVLVWMPEKMNIPAANAILKNLEEPPEKTLFLLVTSDIEKNITTIISRCQSVQIPPFSDVEVTTFLESKMQLLPEESGRIALMADGDLHEAIKLIDHNNSDEVEAYFQTWMRTCYGMKFDILVKDADKYSKTSKDAQKMLFQVGLNTMRNILLMHGEVQDLIRAQEEDKQFVQKFSVVVTREKLENIVPLLEEAYYHIERNVNAKIVFLDLSLSISKIFKSK